MKSEALWQAFKTTGDVNDYLKYKRLEAYSDAAYNNGACNQSGENRRSG